MGKVAINRPRGTRDFGPVEMGNRRKVEEILRDVAGAFSYHEIATPTFEHLDLFTQKSGEEVIKQLYTFEDKGGRTLALRPELTAAVLRFFSEEMAYQPKPVKVFYMGNCFRYERPQKGRYREFWQFGAECIGSNTPEAISEIITLAHTCIRSAGLQNSELRIGHLGILKGLLDNLGCNDKAVMTLIDKGNITGLRDLLEDRGVKNGETLFRLLELKGDPSALSIAIKLLENATYEDKMRNDQKIVGPSPDNKNSSERSSIEMGLESLRMVTELVKRSGVEHILDFGIARGLDYYTGIVFEVDVPSLGAEKQICGGGEYNLNEIFNLRTKGTSGFAIGFDRLVLALESEGITFPPIPPLIGIIPTPGTTAIAFELASKYRTHGIPTELDVSGRGLKKALSRMNDLQVNFTVITGEREIEHGTVMVRDMSSGDQEEVPIDSVVSYVLGRLRSSSGFDQPDEEEGN